MKTSNKLAIRLPNWVGDAVMALPAIDALSNAGFELSLYGKAWMHSLLSAYAYPMTTLPSDFFSVRKLWTQVPAKHILLLTNSLSSAARVFFSGKKAVGYSTDVRRFLLSSSLPKQGNHHEVDYFWQLSQHVTTQLYQLPWPDEAAKTLTLKLSEQAFVDAKQILAQSTITSPYIVLCPGAAGLGENAQSKVWPYWQQLAARLTQQGYQLITCPGPGEEQMFHQLLPSTVTFLNGVNLDTYAAVMANACAVIANDSGPMHIAAAVTKSVLGIFGATSPQRTHPWGGDYLGELNNWPSVDSVLKWLEPKFSGKNTN